jgi:PAS domain S-box-containing protein/diguanylate cyclase (GGDEF)-like protein
VGKENVDEKNLRVLILEDVAADAELMVHELHRAGGAFDWQRVSREQDFAAALDDPPDVILADYAMPGFSVSEAIAIMRSRSLDIPFIVVTGTLGDDEASRCMRLGVADYLLKDRLARLPEAVVQALDKKRLREQQAHADRSLRESERLKDAIIRSALDSVITIDGEGRIIEFNPAAEQTFGYPRAAVLGKPMAELIVPPSLRDAHHHGFARFLATGESRILGRRVELTAQRADGSEFPIELSILATGTWDAPLFTATIRDIADRRLAEEKIRRLNRVYAVLSAINALIVRVRDRKTLFDEACRIAVEHGQFPLAWIGALDPKTLTVTPAAIAGLEDNNAFTIPSTIRNDVPAGHGALGRALRERKPVFEHDIATNIGVGGPRRKLALQHGFRSLISLPLFIEDEVFGNLSLFAKESHFFDEEEVRLLSELAADISFALAHIGKAERLDYLAYYDALTDLPNRTLFFERLNRGLHAARQSGQNVALVIGDIRHLRLINESFGRQTGDALLREIARRFRHAWPDPERVGRIAADCLAGFLPDVKEATGVAQLLEGSINAAITAPFDIDGKELGFSMIFGIALFPADGEDAALLFKNADAALNKAKRSGEHYLFYQPQMNATVTESLLLQNKLRRALEKEQFVLHYQPKVDALSGRVNGVEALMRWLDPEVGLVPPAQFIPVLEETGMILEVGRWAIRKALDDYREWGKLMEAPPCIAVNVSTIQLRRGDFVEGIRTTIGAADSAARGLDLEITESMVMDDIEDNITKLRAVRNMGVGIAIDDFGTGYSSLSYLAKLPLNALKIDRSFIITMTDNAESMNIVSTIISLARSLKLKVVAEGVETEEQARLLRLLRCDEIQGYLISKPLPASELIDFLRAKPASSR